MSDSTKLSVGFNVDVGATVSELTKAATKFKENRTYNKAAYDELLAKYAEALELISQLEVDLSKANESKMPTGEEIENMGKMFDMLGTINDKLPELVKLQQSMKSLES